MTGCRSWGSHLSSLFIVFPLKLIVECEQVKTERETELISEQVLIAMSEMGLDRERTIQVGCIDFPEFCIVIFEIYSEFKRGAFFFFSPYKRTSTITTAPSTVCWQTASRNIRLCLLSCRRHGPLAILLMLYRYIATVRMSCLCFYPYLIFDYKIRSYFLHSIFIHLNESALHFCLNLLSQMKGF